jgi:predicted site-specific integrase-resolvase
MGARGATMTRTIIYTRVSTADQADRGVSLEAQEAKARAYAAVYDLDVIEVITDAGSSAKTLERPGLQRALALLKAGKADADCVNEPRLTLLMNFGSPSAICILLKPLGRSAASSVLQDRA